MNIHTKYNKGFTLIEMLITVAIVSILASIALPSFSKLIERNRITTATNELVSNLLLTKSEALKRSNSVTLCPSTNQSTCSENKDYSAGWIIYLDCGDIGKRVTTKRRRVVILVLLVIQKRHFLKFLDHLALSLRLIQPIFR